MELALPQVRCHTKQEVTSRDARTKKILQKCEAQNRAYNTNFFRFIDDRVQSGIFYYNTEETENQSRYTGYPNSQTDLERVEDYIDNWWRDYTELNRTWLTQSSIIATYLPTWSTAVRYFAGVWLQQNNSQQSSYSNFIDSEGNSILIEKTPTNQVEIKTIFYVQELLPPIEPKVMSNGKYDFQLVPPGLRRHRFLVNQGDVGNNSHYHYTLLVMTGDFVNYDTYSVTINKKTMNNILQQGQKTRASMTSFYPVHGGVSDSYFNDYHYQQNEYQKNKIIPAQVGIPTGYIHCLKKNLSVIYPLPNPDIFPQTIIKNYPLGTGDGIATHFTTWLDEIVINNSSILQNTTELPISNGISFINADFKKSPLYNKLVTSVYLQQLPKNTDTIVSVFREQPLIEATNTLYSQWIQKDEILCAMMCDKQQTSPVGANNAFIQGRYDTYYNPPHIYCEEKAPILGYDNNWQIKYCDQLILTEHDWVKNKRLYLYDNISYHACRQFIPIQSTNNKLALDSLYIQQLPQQNWSNNYSGILYCSSQAQLIFGADDLTSLNLIYYSPVISRMTKPQSQTFMKDELTKYEFSYWGISIWTNTYDTYDKTEALKDFVIYSQNRVILSDTATYDVTKIGVTFDTPPADGDLLYLNGAVECPFLSPDITYEISGTAVLDFTGTEPETEV